MVRYMDSNLRNIPRMLHVVHVSMLGKSVNSSPGRNEVPAGSAFHGNHPCADLADPEPAVVLEGPRAHPCSEVEAHHSS